MVLTKAQLQDDLMALAACIYFESRGESVDCQRWVGHVVKNRVTSPKFPDSIPLVVFQPYQFSWANKRTLFTIKEVDAWARSKEIAAETLIHEDITFNSLYFVSGSVRPSCWLRKLKLVKEIGTTRFYRE